jgi:ABC-type transport system substrate-binding protein/DNA-binding SARP family transcriptional activator/DNA-binding beta-propeller fold protein YncE
VSRPLQFRILGPLEVARDDGPLDLPAGKPRALLAVLLLHQGEVVSVDRLVDELWGEAPPPTAAKNVQGYVARLRRVLGNGTLVTRAPGYALRVEALDAARFQTLVEEARHEEPAGAAPRLEEALALWRGPPLADFAYEPFAQDEIRRLEELRLSALEDRIVADLALGRHEGVVAELESVAREHPLRERLQGLRVIALYRCGRQAEALEAYRSTRRRLVDDLGLEPGPELKELERRILEHDPSLEAPRREGRSVPAVSKLSRRSAVIAFAGLLAAGGVAAILAVALSEKEADALAAAPNSVGVVDGRHDRLKIVIRAGGEPGGIAAGAGAVWVTDTASDLLLRIGQNGRSLDRIPVGHRPTGVAVGDGQVWVVNQLDRTVSEVNPRALRQVRSIQVGNGAGAIAFAHGSVWVANATDYTLSRIDPDSGRVKTIHLAGDPGGIAPSSQGMWVSSTSTGQLLLVDARTNAVTQSVPIGNGPQGVAVGGGAVWVANTPDGTVSRFDPGTGRIRKIAVGGSPTGVAYRDGVVWVAAGRSGNVLRIDASSGSAQPVVVGNEPTGVAIVGRDAWVTALPGSASHRGGTLRLALPADDVPYSPDPTQFSGPPQWQLLSLTSDGLVTYRKVGGLAGAELVPDLATTIPQPTDGGRTYTFRLREGIRYSNGARVQPADIRRGIGRTMRSGNPYLASQYAGIVGTERCGPRACDLGNGIVTDREGGTVTFHLIRPDPDFLYKLAFSMASAVPAGKFGGKALPATGPYMTASFASNRAWVLVRNPWFHEWSRDAQPEGFPDRIVLKAAPPDQVAALEHGAADALLAPPLENVDELARRYANQVHIDPAGATFPFVMNTRIPPFDRLAVRRALNYAIDRNRIARLTGSSLTAQPTCQVLPPTVPGYRPYCPYTLDPSPSGLWTAPDLARAERLVAGSGTRGTKITLLMMPPPPGAPMMQIGRYVVSVLDRLGYRASLRVIANAGGGLGDLGDSSKRPQIGWFNWLQDYPTPSDFFGLLLSCRSFVPGSPNNINAAEFCDRRIDAQVARASALQARDPAAAGGLWSRIDHELVDRAPWVPVYNLRTVTVLGPRVGNYKYHPFWNVLLDQLWVR